MSNEHENRLDGWLALTGQTAMPADPVQLPLLTGSMVPAIPVGAILHITAATAQECRAGDVVIFLEDERLLAHRILLVLRAGPWHWLLEKGDANALGRWRRANSVRGRVLGYTDPDETVRADPADPALASLGLRRHLLRLLRTPGGQAPTEPKV